MRKLAFFALMMFLLISLFGCKSSTRIAHRYLESELHDTTIVFGKKWVLTNVVKKRGRVELESPEFLAHPVVYRFTKNAVYRESERVSDSFSVRFSILDGYGPTNFLFITNDPREGNEKQWLYPTVVTKCYMIIDVQCCAKNRVDVCNSKYCTTWCFKAVED